MKIVLHRMRALSVENQQHARTMLKALEALGLMDDGQSPPLHERTRNLVDRFAQALKEKLSAAEEKYGYGDGWADPSWMDECRASLIEHVHKGDPRDVAAYCAFLWHHGERTALEEQFIYDVLGKWPGVAASCPPGVKEVPRG